MKPVVATLAEIPEPLREHYESRDGAFHLRLEGDPAGYVPAAQLATERTRLAEFRTNNENLLKALGDPTLSPAAAVAKLEALKAIDPEKYKALQTKVKELEDKGVKDPSDIDSRIKAATDASLASVKTTLEGLQTRLDASEREKKEAQASLQRKELEGVLQTAGLKLGVDERALTDFLARGARAWSYVDGKLVAKEGDTPILNKKTGNPISVEEWVVERMEDAPHLFKPSKGGGAPPTPGGGGGGGPQGGTRKKMVNPSPSELGRLRHVPGKGLVDPVDSMPVEIVNQ